MLIAIEKPDEHTKNNWITGGGSSLGGYVAGNPHIEDDILDFGKPYWLEPADDEIRLVGNQSCAQLPDPTRERRQGKIGGLYFAEPQTRLYRGVS
jgi:hypothetical protein